MMKLRDSIFAGVQLLNKRENPMSELIYEHPAKVTDHGTTYTARVRGAERPDGTWQGWLEFQPNDGNKPVLRTDPETSQPNRVTIRYWALGLEPLYLEGALARAQGRLL
jgi:hypothetical protein